MYINILCPKILKLHFSHKKDFMLWFSINCSTLFLIFFCFNSWSTELNFKFDIPKSKFLFPRFKKIILDLTKLTKFSSNTKKTKKLFQKMYLFWLVRMAEAQ